MRAVFPRGWSLALLLLLATGCEGCRDQTNGKPFEFDEPDSGLDAVRLDADPPSAHDIGEPVDLTNDTFTSDADMGPDVRCIIPGLDAEPPMRNGEVRRHYVCDDGVLHNFWTWPLSGCGGEVDDFNGFRHYPFEFGEVFAGRDGCSACVCTREGALDCVSACGIPVCEYDGRVLAAGETFLSQDGRRVCACRGDGKVECSDDQTATEVGCVVDGQRVTSGTAVPTPSDACDGPCWCEVFGEVSCFEYPNCNGCTDVDGALYDVAESTTFDDCGTCTCGDDHLWSCGSECAVNPTCAVGVTEVPDGTIWRHERNEYHCSDGTIFQTLVGMIACRELNQGDIAYRGEVFYSTDGCTACVCGEWSGGEELVADNTCVATCTDGCTVGDHVYGAGEVFRADDGCNACICGGDGNVLCTQQRCPDVTCEGSYLPGETWFVRGDEPQLCTCNGVSEVVCRTERHCFRDWEGGGDCLEGEVCEDGWCR